MNYSLLENALEYHGAPLYNHILKKGELTYATLPPPNTLKPNVSKEFHSTEISHFKTERFNKF